eukprot:TRINITY_DN4565_c0_g1_i3.p1 TRINITY_DN4565_c0_g1~~TRINITY_DN4565_c0_g1_i3.p1  ORF type:complete len:372 (-),score=42.15 TRINITY_DN4565_c0_g1_i3:118-1233(-)
MFSANKITGMTVVLSETLKEIISDQDKFQQEHPYSVFNQQRTNAGKWKYVAVKPWENVQKGQIPVQTGRRPNAGYTGHVPALRETHSATYGSSLNLAKHAAQSSTIRQGEHYSDGAHFSSTQEVGSLAGGKLPAMPASATNSIAPSVCSSARRSTCSSNRSRGSRHSGVSNRSSGSNRSGLAGNTLGPIKSSTIGDSETRSQHSQRSGTRSQLSQRSGVSDMLGKRETQSQHSQRSGASGMRSQRSGVSDMLGNSETQSQHSQRSCAGTQPQYSQRSGAGTQSQHSQRSGASGMRSQRSGVSDMLGNSETQSQRSYRSGISEGSSIRSSQQSTYSTMSQAAQAHRVKQLFRELPPSRQQSLMQEMSSSIIG